MPFDDLREYLSRLDVLGELHSAPRGPRAGNRSLTEMAAECRGPALLSPKAERKDEIAKRYHARFNLKGSSLLSRRTYLTVSAMFIRLSRLFLSIGPSLASPNW